jgi:catechol 2,3-dioxygenase-like lactoylglutathione lyase family enzyme
VSVRWYSVVVDCHDVAAQGRWWADVLGWDIVYEAEDEVVVAGARLLELEPGDRGPGLVFVSVPEAKELKNRLHIDLSPPADGDQEAEVQRLVDLGATTVNVGQDEGAVTWVVLADPEGNEFCILSARD